MSAEVLSASDAERLVDGLRSFPIRDIGSPEYVLWWRNGAVAASAVVNLRLTWPLRLWVNLQVDEAA